MPKFCTNCGSPLSETAKFCRNCGNTVVKKTTGEAQDQPGVSKLSQDYKLCPGCGANVRNTALFCRSCGYKFSGQNTIQNNSDPAPVKPPVKKKGSPLTKVLIALALVVCISGVTLGGYLLFGFITGHSGSGKLSYPKGNSKAFSIEPVEGITISAKKDALDRDREISFTEIEDESYYDTYEEPLKNLGSDMLAAYEFDMGLEPEETIPGYVDLSFDLKEMGVPEELWEDITVYRQREEFDKDTPEGSFEEYQSELSDKGILTVNTTKNCGVVVTISAIVVGLPTVIGVVDSGKNYVEQNSHFIMDSITVRNRGKWDFNVRVNLNDTEFKDDKYKEAKKSVNELKDYLKELDKKAEEEYIKEVYKRADTGNERVLLFKAISNKLRAEQVKKIFDKDMFKKRYIQKDEKLKKLIEEIKIPESIRKTIELVNDSYEYLNAQSIKIPSRVVDFDVLPMDDLGRKVSAFTYPSYMQLNSKALVKNGQYDPSGVDGFRLTCTHEFFHLCQEEYVPNAAKKKIKELIEDTRFEEATAAVLERDASRYYYDKGIQKTNPEQGSGGSLGYVARGDQFCYTAPLNKLPKIKKSKGEKDPWVNIGYTEADLIDFLRDNKKMVSVTALMNRYKVTSPQTAFIDILRSEDTFDIKDDKKWSDLYHKFILTQTKTIGQANSEGMNRFPDYYKDVKLTPSIDGDVVKWVITEKNASYARTIYPQYGKKRENRKKYIVVLEADEKFSDDDAVMLRAMNHGFELVYKDRNYTDPTDKDRACVLISCANGKMDSENPLEVYGICIFEPDQQNFSLEGNSVRVSTPEAPEKLKAAGKVNLLRTTVSYKKEKVEKDTEVNSDDPENMLGKDIVVDISDFGEISEDEAVTVTQAWVYIDKEGKEYIGPEAEAKDAGCNIAGTYDFDATMNYSSAMLGGLVDTMKKYSGGVMDEYVEKYGGALRGQSGIKSTGKITIEEVKGQNTYVVKMKYNDQNAPMETYDATYDGKTAVLTMKPRKKTVTDSKGKSYDLSVMGLQADVKLTFKYERDKDTKKRKITFTGEGANDQKNQVVAFSFSLNGNKVKDEIINLEGDK